MLDVVFFFSTRIYFFSARNSRACICHSNFSLYTCIVIYFQHKNSITDFIHKKFLGYNVPIFALILYTINVKYPFAQQLFSVIFFHMNTFIQPPQFHYRSPLHVFSAITGLSLFDIYFYYSDIFFPILVNIFLIVSCTI